MTWQQYVNIVTSGAITVASILTYSELKTKLNYGVAWPVLCSIYGLLGVYRFLSVYRKLDKYYFFMSSMSAGVGIPYLMADLCVQEKYSQHIVYGILALPLLYFAMYVIGYSNLRDRLCDLATLVSSGSFAYHHYNQKKRKNSGVAAGILMFVLVALVNHSLKRFLKVDRQDWYRIGLLVFDYLLVQTFNS